VADVANRARQIRGFTLIELISTLAIFSILLMLAAPSYNGLRGPYALQQAAQQITAEFQKGRMRAIARNARYRFTYDETTRAYLLQRETGANAWTTESTSQLPTGVTTNALGSPPIFDTRGLLNAPVTITVTVQGHAKTKTMTINLLGHVTVV
jgi:prepilin-type N-terminal cleavage/methylation domain-containing protein